MMNDGLGNKDMFDLSLWEWGNKFQLIKNVKPLENGLSTSWQPGSFYGDMIVHAMYNAEYMFCEDLLLELKLAGKQGAVVEFGVFTGDWIERISKSLKKLKFDLPIYGFDSFEGLPETSKFDNPVFKRGDYRADYDAVVKRLEPDKNNIHLVKGLFSASLKQPVAQSIENICYARIDCDLYEGAKDCLEFLKDRLIDGAILVFDDWSHWLGHGEPRAFVEWAPTSGLKFEFLALNGWIHLYLRVVKS